MAQGQQPITTRFLTWAECFTTTAETPVNTRFVNADGKSIMDLLKEDGTDIVAFYADKGDIHAFLNKHGAKLDDFQWDSPFGVLSISQALAKINAGEIKIPIGGRSQLWSLERMLCFKGNTYAELFVSTGTIVYGRMRDMAQQVSLKKLVTSLAIATVGMGYLSYYTSVGFWSLFDGDQANQEEVAEISELVIGNALDGGFPTYKTDFAQFLPVTAHSIEDAGRTVDAYAKEYGNMMVGNHWTAIQASIARIEESQGRSGVNQAAIANFFSLVKNGLPLNPQSCAEIAADPAQTKMGGKYSMALYAGALDEQAAADALSSMVEGWHRTGQVNLPARSQMLGQVPDERLSRALWHVGGTLENGSYSECAISPIVGITPKAAGPFRGRNFTLVSMLVRTPLTNGDASVSMRLYAFANQDDGSAAKLIEAKVVGGREAFSRALVARIPELAPESLEASCTAFNVEAPATLKEEFVVYKVFLDSTPSTGLVDHTDFASWEKSGDFPKHIPIVDLEQFITHRKSGDCLAMPVVAYKLNSDATKYLVSLITKSGDNRINRTLVSVYDTGEERGVVKIGSDSKEFKGAMEEGFRKTYADLTADLRKTPYGNPDVSIDEVKGIVLAWMQRNGFIKDEADFEQKLSIVDKNLIEVAVDNSLKKTKNVAAMIDYEAIVDAMEKSGYISDKEIKDRLVSEISRGVSVHIASSESIGVDELTSVIQVSLKNVVESAQFTDESRASLKSSITQLLADYYDFSGLSVKAAFDDAISGNSELEELKQKFNLRAFMNESESLENLILPVYESAQKKAPELASVSFQEFTGAVCSAYGMDFKACSSALKTNIKKEFLN